MSDNPLDKIPVHNRVSIRAVLVHEGEDASAALAEAGFAETISVPVVMGEQPDLSGGILGNGITPNLTAVLETDPDDAADPSPNVRPVAAQSERGDVGRSGPVTTTLPPAFGMQPLAPVRPYSEARVIAGRAAGAPPNPYVPPDAVNASLSAQPGSARATTGDVQASEPISTAPTGTFGKPPPVPGLLSEALQQNAGSSDAPPRTRNSVSTPSAAQADTDRASRRAAFAAHRPEAFAPVPFVDDKGQGYLNFRGKPMLRPAGLDPNFFVEQGLKDKRVEGELFSSGGEGGDIAALAYRTAALARLGRGGAWDAQRLGGTYHPEFVDYSTVAIGLYAAAYGIPRKEILETENLVAITSHFKDSGQMDKVYTHLPERNVHNTDLGYQLYQSSRVAATSKP